MCGIVAAAARREVSEILLEGLRRLEYRGYDSAGMALINDEQQLQIHKRKGKVRELELAQQQQPYLRKYRYRPHALGDPRGALRCKRPSPHFGMARGPGSQRHYREPRDAAGRADPGGL